MKGRNWLEPLKGQRNVSKIAKRNRDKEKKKKRREGGKKKVITTLNP